MAIKISAKVSPWFSLFNDILFGGPDNEILSRAEIAYAITKLDSVDTLEWSDITLMTYALNAGRVDIALMLLEAGADPWAGSEKRAIDIASECGYYEFIAAVVKKYGT